MQDGVHWKREKFELHGRWIEPWQDSSRRSLKDEVVVERYDRPDVERSQ